MVSAMSCAVKPIIRLLRMGRGVGEGGHFSQKFWQTASEQKQNSHMEL